MKPEYNVALCLWYPKSQHFMLTAPKGEIYIYRYIVGLLNTIHLFYVINRKAWVSIKLKAKNKRDIIL